MLLSPPLGCNRPDDAAHLEPSLPRGTGEVADARISSSRSDAPVSNRARKLLLDFEKILSRRPKIPVGGGELDLESLRELYKRLVRCRFIAHKLSRGESTDALGDELPTFVEDIVSVEDLHYNVRLYFCYLMQGEADTIGWCFDTECESEDLDGYQRLVLENHPTLIKKNKKGNHLLTDCFVYRNWQLYRSLFTTYEMDKDYVKFVKEMSSKLEWLKFGVEYPETSDQWSDIYRIGACQALEIAIKYTHMNKVLAYTAYKEYIGSLRFDYTYREDKDRLFFEIRKHVTHGKITFKDALEELLREKSFPRHEGLMRSALQKDIWSGLENEYNSCVEGIPDDASEDNAKALIRAAVSKLHEMKKSLHHYMERKMEIAESIGLVNIPTSQVSH